MIDKRSLSSMWFTVEEELLTLMIVAELNQVVPPVNNVIFPIPKAYLMRKPSIIWMDHCSSTGERINVPYNVTTMSISCQKVIGTHLRRLNCPRSSSVIGVQVLHRNATNRSRNILWRDLANEPGAVGNRWQMKSPLKVLIQLKANQRYLLSLTKQSRRKWFLTFRRSPSLLNILGSRARKKSSIASAIFKVEKQI